MSPATLLPEGERTDHWARRFIEEWYRGQVNLADDFRRFAREHGVPSHADAAVRERAQELLLAPLVPRARHCRFGVPRGERNAPHGSVAV